MKRKPKKEVRRVEFVKCSTCGTNPRQEEGCAWDEVRRNYFPCYRYVCNHCGKFAPTKEDMIDAAIAWNEMQKGELQDA